MKRRDFSAGLLTLGAAGTAAGPLIANPNEERRGGAEELLARVNLQLLASTVLLTWFVIATQRGFLGVDLTQPSARYEENRASLGRIPLLGQIQRPLLTDRFARALLVGQLVLFSSYLILLPTLRDTLRNKRVVIANQDKSWEPSGPTAPVRLSRIPALGALLDLPRVGTAHLKGAELLLIVRPSIIRLRDE